MKILRIRIDGFGRFAGNEFGPLDQPVTVFHGPNEAGKSTLLEFIRTILFGFRPRLGRPPRGGWPNDYTPLSGGRHGGRITLVDGHGQQSVVERFSGGGFGLVTVAGGASTAQDEAVLAQLLGNHSRAVYERIFAFTLDELYSDDLLNDESVNSQIYSAGMGVTSLPKAIRSIETARREIFVKGGSTQKVYEVCGKIAKMDGRLQDVAGNAAAFSNLTTRLKQVDKQIADLTARRERIRSRHSRQVIFQTAWDPWNDLQSAKSELARLPVIDNFPTNGTTRLETLQERIRHARREYESTRARVAEARARVDAQIEHKAILEHSAAVRGLERSRTSFDNSVHDLPEREAELAEHERSFAETLRDLGPGWDEGRLEGFDLSIAVREEISQHQVRLRETGVKLERYKANLTQANAALAEATEAENRARRELKAANEPSFDQERVRQRRALIRTVRSQLQKMQSVREQVSLLQGQLDGLATPIVPVKPRTSSKAVGAIAVLAGSASVVGGIILGGPTRSVGIAAGLALVAIALYVLAAGKSSPGSSTESPLASSLRDSLSRATDELAELRSGLEQDAASLDLETIDEASLIAAEGSLDDHEASIRVWTSLAESLDRAEDLTKQRKSRSHQAREAVDETTTQLETVKREWQEWLRLRGLRNNFLPEAVVELRGKVELGLTQLREVQSWRQRIKAIQKDIDQYIEVVGPLAAAFDTPFDRNDTSIVATVADRLVELFARVQSRVRDRTDAKSEFKDAERQLAERKGDLETAEEELTELIRSGNAEDPEDFRLRADLFKKRTALDEQMRTALNQLQRLSGPGEPLESLKTELSRTDSQSTTDEIERLEQERASADSQVGELSTERGAIQTELQRLEGEEESSRLRMERNVSCEQLRGHARDWTRFTLAQRLLEEARMKFERERQPGVVRHAQEFFAEITEGRYRQVYAPLGEQTITVTDADGRTKQPSELSRGTREQLFLSLRFGLIRELSQRTKPLPVVVDEILVNFDPDRALRAGLAFVELSRTNQVLVFTCQPTVVELFRSAASKAGVEAPDEIRIA